MTRTIVSGVPTMILARQMNAECSASAYYKAARLSAVVD